MTRLTARVLALLAVLSLGLTISVLAPQPAWACSCGRADNQPALERADAVFVGRVLEKTTIRKPSPGRVDLRLQVSRVYKGTVFAEQVVASPQGSDGCGVDLPVGSEWVIFADDRVEGSGDATVFRLVTQQCSGNIRGSTVPSSFGQGRPPIAGASDREEKAVTTDASVTRVLKGGGFALAGLVVLLGIGLLVLWRPGRVPPR